MTLTTTLAMAAAAAVINIWLMLRIGAIRRAESISVGDGGNEALIRRMRAQANFIESAPFVLALIAVIEIAGKGGQWLPIVAAIYMIGRALHAIGMDGNLGWGRFAGTLTAMLAMLGLGIVAVLIAVGVM